MSRQLSYLHKLVAVQIIKNEYKYGFMPVNSTESRLNDDQVTLLWAITISIFGAGGLVGGFTGSYFATKLGR